MTIALVVFGLACVLYALRAVAMVVLELPQATRHDPEYVAHLEEYMCMRPIRPHAPERRPLAEGPRRGRRAREQHQIRPPAPPRRPSRPDEPTNPTTEDTAAQRGTDTDE